MQTELCSEVKVRMEKCLVALGPCFQTGRLCLLARRPSRLSTEVPCSWTPRLAGVLRQGAGEGGSASSGQMHVVSASCHGGGVCCRKVRDPDSSFLDVSRRRLPLLRTETKAPLCLLLRV